MIIDVVRDQLTKKDVPHSVGSFINGQQQENGGLSCGVLIYNVVYIHKNDFHTLTLYSAILLALDFTCGFLAFSTLVWGAENSLYSGDSLVLYGSSGVSPEFPE